MYKYITLSLKYSMRKTESNIHLLIFLYGNTLFLTFQLPGNDFHGNSIKYILAM